MQKLLAEPLFYIFFIYGVSFLLVFYLVMKGAMRSTSVPLISSFVMLAFFGLTHGITELVDWVRFMVKTVTAREIVFLTYLSQAMLITSFVILFQFGINLLSYDSSRKHILKKLPTILFALFIVIVFFMGISDILRIGLLSRYSFGFTGSLLSAIGLFKLVPLMRPLGDDKLSNGIVIAAVGFACYSVFGGLIISPIAGIPVQLFRAACALTIAFSSFSVIEVYKYIKVRSAAA